MPKVEVDEEELLRDRKLRDTLGKIVANPKAKLLLQEAHKMVDPQAITPELDAQKPVNDQMTEFGKKIDDFISKQETKEADREKQSKLDALNANIAKGLDKLRSERWTEDGIKGVQEIMEKHGILDVEIAASHYEKLHPPQDLVKPGGGSWNFFETPSDDDADLKKLLDTKGQSMPLTDKMVHEALADVRGQARR